MPWSRWIAVSLSAAALLVACGDGDETQPQATDTPGAEATPTGTQEPTAAPTATQTAVPEGFGTLQITFRMEPDWYTIMPGTDVPPVGPFWGDIYRGEDVTNLGPKQGTEALGGIYVESVALDESGGPTAVLFTTGDLPSGEVAILGFLDSDGNADPESPDPDQGDPVTLPGENRFQVKAGKVETAEVFFNFLNP